MNKEELIIKWLDGQLNDAELKQLMQLPEYKTYKKILDNAHNFKPKDVDKEQHYAKFKTLTTHKKKSSKIRTLKFNFILRAAAVVLVGFGIYFTFLKSEMVKFSTNVAQQINVNLPDNSEVRLNAFSSLNYNEKEWKNSKKLTLEGEAYFKVTKGKKFDVITNIGTITVIGTEFNVNQRGDRLEVQCYEGVVGVIINNNKTVLNAGFSLLLLDNELVERKIRNTVPSWIKGKSTFESVPFYLVVAEFERQYDVKITVKGFDDKMLFTGSFDNKNKELALKSITQPFRLNFEINNNHITIVKND